MTISPYNKLFLFSILLILVIAFCKRAASSATPEGKSPTQLESDKSQDLKCTDSLWTVWGKQVTPAAVISLSSDFVWHDKFFADPGVYWIHLIDSKSFSIKSSTLHAYVESQGTLNDSGITIKTRRFYDHHSSPGNPTVWHTTEDDTMFTLITIFYFISNPESESLGYSGESPSVALTQICLSGKLSKAPTAYPVVVISNLDSKAFLPGIFFPPTPNGLTQIRSVMENDIAQYKPQ